MYTTSRQLHQNIDTRWSKSVPLRAGDPQDQTRHDTAPRTDISSSSRCRNHSFVNQVANQLCRDLGHPLLIEELLVGSDGEAERKEPNSDQAVAAARQVLKRRRLLGKQPPPGATSVPSSSLTSDSNAQPTWGGVFQHLNGKVPVKKRIGFNEGDHEVTLAQQLMPDFAVKHIVVCRGTNRVQPPHASCDVRDIPLRYTMVVKRADGEIAVDGGIEEWTQIPQYKQGRKGIPAKMSLQPMELPRLLCGEI